MIKSKVLVAGEKVTVKHFANSLIKLGAIRKEDEYTGWKVDNKVDTAEGVYMEIWLLLPVIDDDEF